MPKLDSPSSNQNLPPGTARGLETGVSSAQPTVKDCEIILFTFNSLRKFLITVNFLSKPEAIIYLEPTVLLSSRKKLIFLPAYLPKVRDQLQHL